MQHIPTNNIKIASALVAIGFQPRQPDPVTCEESEKNGRPFKQYTFWFDGPKEELSKYINAGHVFLKEWKFTLNPEDKFYYILSGLYNREIFLNWMKQAMPFTHTMVGSQALLMPVNPSQHLQDLMRPHLR